MLTIVLIAGSDAILLGAETLRGLCWSYSKFTVGYRPGF
jgi:hypothetical protein